ncbi:unnamed protein product [Rhizoctonia solani]|uniref:6-pyruvoyltetrahydropterin synthase n=1 Tax=Rhizoctonia solani TaxID=456999 RepID=A0A8H3BY23_9AGAM|nr:unnamed protein product [Rhizoctonia solani]
MALPTIPRLQVEPVPVVRLSRTFNVSAAHRLHSIYLSDDDNVKLYGPCNRQYGHGHNYKITVSLAGRVDPHTGMVVNLCVVKSIAQQYVADLLDHRNLDIEVDYFIKRPSTTENLAVLVWQRMCLGLKDRGLPESLLDNVTIEETDSNCVSYSGNPALFLLLPPDINQPTTTTQWEVTLKLNLQAALAKMQQPAYEHSIAKTVSPVVEISTVGAETEAERKYKEIVSTLETKLSETNKQLQNTYRDLSDARDQLEKQRAKSVQLEQRILQMSEVEGIVKSTLAVFRAEKDKALARERDALLSRDRAGMHNAQLSNQLTGLQSELDLKIAQLNDATYIRQQLESRVNDLNKENMSLRRATSAQAAPTGAPIQSGAAAAATSPQSTQPPSNLYFSVPITGAARRHTVPNVYPPAQTVPHSLPLNRPPKRARADSDGSAASDGSRSRVSSAGSMTFALRPVKLEPTESNPSTSAQTVPMYNASHPQYRAYSPVSPTAPVSPHYIQQPQQQQTYATPISYQNQASYQTRAQGLPPASPTVATAHSVTRPPTMASTTAQMMQHAPVQRMPTVQQFIDQIFLYTPAGFAECKICKVQPSGHATANGTPTIPSVADLLAHAENHGRSLVPKFGQQL